MKILKLIGAVNIFFNLAKGAAKVSPEISGSMQFNNPQEAQSLLGISHFKFNKYVGTKKFSQI